MYFAEIILMRRHKRLNFSHFLVFMRKAPKKATYLHLWGKKDLYWSLNPACRFLDGIFHWKDTFLQSNLYQKWKQQKEQNRCDRKRKQQERESGRESWKMLQVSRPDFLIRSISDCCKKGKLFWESVFMKDNRFWHRSNTETKTGKTDQYSVGSGLFHGVIRKQSGTEEETKEKCSGKFTIFRQNTSSGLYSYITEYIIS